MKNQAEIFEAMTTNYATAAAMIDSIIASYADKDYDNVMQVRELDEAYNKYMFLQKYARNDDIASLMRGYIRYIRPRQVYPGEQLPDGLNRGKV